MICKNCGTQYGKDSKFCVYCGVELSKNDIVSVNKGKLFKIFILLISILLILILAFFAKRFLDEKIALNKSNISGKETFVGKDEKIIFTGDIRNVNWGMTKEEVKKIETARPNSNKEDGQIMGFRISEDEAVEGFEFVMNYNFGPTNSLEGGIMTISHKNPEVGKELFYFNKLKEYYENIYGEGKKDLTGLDSGQAYSWETPKTKITLSYGMAVDKPLYLVFYKQK